jgi:peptidoglycan hydrolase CwlO-like protein
MKRFLTSILLAALLVGAAPAASAQQTPALASAMERAATEEALVRDLQSELHESMTELQGMLSRIDALKLEESPSAAEVLELQNLLREADLRLGELEQLDVRVRAAVAAWQTLSAGVVAQVRAERDSLIAQGAELWLQNRDVDAELRELERVELHFAAPEIERQPLPLQEIRASLTQTPEELEATADELADEAQRLQRQMAELQVREEDAERRERLQQRSREMLFDETFFEDSASRRAPARSTPVSDSNSTPTFQGRPGTTESDDTPSPPESVNGPSDALASGGAEGAPEPEFAAEVSDNGGVRGEGVSGDFGAVDLSPELPPAVVAPGEQASALGDPTLLRNDTDPAPGGRGRTRASDLRAQRESLQRQLEAVERERTRLLDEADALQNDVR